VREIEGIKGAEWWAKGQQTCGGEEGVGEEGELRRESLERHDVARFDSGAWPQSSY